MGTVISLDKYRKNEPAPQVTAAHNTVEYMRKEMYHLPGNQARMEYALVLISQLMLWVIKADHYDNPVEFIKVWVNKKCADYTKKRSGE